MSSCKQMDSILVSVGILTVSDTSFADPTLDRSGPTLISILSSPPVSWKIHATAIVPDDSTEIQRVVMDWCDHNKLDLIVTTGGTGFGARDVTPEAISPLIEKQTPGLTHVLLATSLHVTPFAALSRPVTGIRGKTIILTFPGSPKACKENADAILGILPHAIELIRGGDGKATHEKMQGGESYHHSQQQHQQKQHHHHHHHHHQHRDRDGEKIVDNEHHIHLQPKSQSLDAPVTRRHRQSPYPIIPMEMAHSIISEHAKTLESVLNFVDGSLKGAVLAEDVFAKEAVPGYRASIVDGYAVIASDGPGIYPVISVSLATISEENQSMLQSGQIIRVTTGGALPNGATAVVMVEDTKLEKTSEDGTKEELVEILIKASEGDNIREVGSDCNIGELVAKKDDIITAIGGEIGILASVGIREVRVIKRPKVGVLSTGNEVINHNDTETLKYGQIRDSNRPTLIAAIEAAGFEAIDLGIVADSSESLEKSIREGLAQVDVLVTTGGVSMGEMDLLKPILEHKIGAIIHFGRVLMKPGKPTTFATVSLPGESMNNNKLVFALPGNPVSATVTFYLFVLPALRKMAGYKNWALPRLQVELTHTFRLDKRPEYHRAILTPRASEGKTSFVAKSTGHQQSSRMLSMRGANALLKLPAWTETTSELDAGSVVEAILIGQL